MKTIGTLAVAAVFLFAVVGQSQAQSTFYTAFTVGGFPISNGNSAPLDPVSGYIVWTASDIHSQPLALVSIDLTIDGHSYSASELGSYNVLPNWNGIGGVLGSANGVTTQTDDFWISWDAASLMPLGFAYASSTRSGIWVVHPVNNPGSFQSFQIAPIPEPSSMAMFIVGLLGLGAWRARKQI